MVKEDRRTFPSSSSELDDDDDTELVRRKLLKPNLRWKDQLFQDQTLAALHQMRKHKHFCDVTLQVRALNTLNSGDLNKGHLNNELLLFRYSDAR